jgi:hypothetical protein
MVFYPLLLVGSVYLVIRYLGMIVFVSIYGLMVFIYVVYTVVTCYNGNWNHGNCSSGSGGGWGGEGGGCGGGCGG